MPITKTGQEVMGSMVKEYGAKKAKEVFYASINKNKPGSEKWHGKPKKKGKKNYSSATIAKARSKV